MKSVFAAAALATAFVFTAPVVGIDDAEANSRRDRIHVCDWYRTKAQFASKRGNFDKSEFYWHLYRACMNHRID